MKKLIQLIIEPNTLGLHDLILRLFIGATMIYHSLGKLGNLDGTAAFFAKVGIEPAYLMTIMATMGEGLGGLAVMIGLFTRLGAFANVVSMIVAIVFLGWANGFDVRQGGWEYQGTLLITFAFVLVNGAGKFSLDNILYKKLENF